ncbi:SHOCT domain-containing protein [Halorussus salinisoli]|uniref:SHOCT domain-containing protein n=1 Tax=Halorussus salinisoli TaxID=2558242 RepID=UPI0010C1949C|nr:SHOCT domain-containing protein [Halorussus salinisoli]
MNVNSLAVLQMGGGQMGNGMGPGGWGFGYGFVGLAVMVLLLGAVGYLLVRAFSGNGETRSDDARSRTAGFGGDDPALAELRERYARGEIDDEEFEKRAQRLRNDSDSL